MDVTFGTYWRTIAVETAPPGWRLASILQGKGDIRAIPAWLLQEGHRWKGIGDDFEAMIPREPSTLLEDAVGPETRVTPGLFCGDEAGMEPPDYVGHGLEVWKVLGPDEADPTESEWEAEIAYRRTVARTPR